MSTTIQADRPATQVQPPRIERPVPTVPDHVPPEVAAEHPDAAAVVAAPPARPAPQGGVRVVGRGEERPAWALRILGLAACAFLAALSAGSGNAGGGASPVTEPAATTTAPSAVSAPEAPQPQGCPPGTSVVVGCDPPCPTRTLLEFPWQPCPPAGTTRGR